MFVKKMQSNNTYCLTAKKKRLQLSTLMTNKNIVDWYWNHGVARQGNFTLSRAEWLDKAYDIAERQEQLDCIGGPEAPRPTLAVWGPSQSGKSTLLSRYLDLGKSDQGSPCLTWDE
jgi:polynucleotide 5'-kinase involved in rRNA processing